MTQKTNNQMKGITLNNIPKHPSLNFLQANIQIDNLTMELHESMMGNTFVEMIYIPYVSGVPGTAQVFNTIAVPSGENSVINWSHTGTEEILTDIPIDKFSTDNVIWDTCKALAIKDNRLFCGNLKGRVRKE